MGKNKNKNYDNDIDVVLSKSEQSFKEKAEVNIKPYKETKETIEKKKEDTKPIASSKKIKVKSNVALAIKNKDIVFAISTNKPKEITQDLYDKIIKQHPGFKNVLQII